MKTKTFSIFSFLFLILTFSVFATQTTLLDEDFSYTDVFTNHGWSYSGSGLDNQTPTNITIFNPATNLGFGLNFSAGQGAGSSYNRFIYRNFVGNYTQRSVSVKWTFYHNNTNGQLGTFVSAIRLSDYGTGTEYIQVYHEPPSENNRTRVTQVGLTGFSECQVGESHYGNHDYELQVDFVSGVYNLLVDDVYKCSNQSIGTRSIEGWGGLALFQSIPSNTHRPTIMWFDDILVVNSSEALTPAGIGNSSGQYCTKHEDCATGFCDGGFCGLAPAGFVCESNTDCLSGVCSNGHCTNPSFISSMDYFFKHYVGGDSATLNFIALIIILGMTIIVGFYLRSPILAMIVFYAVSVFTLFIGWLSVFLFFIFIIAGIIGAFVMIFLRSRGD